MTKRQRTIMLLVAAAIMFAIIFAAYDQYRTNSNPYQSVPTPAPTPSPSTPAPIAPKTIIEPIADALSRVTKKPYGIYITPATSSVQPEKFTGYHTGTDFEITAAETNSVVPVFAICDGDVRFAGPVDGYGGVIILGCTINSQVVTVLYGHIDIASSPLRVGSHVTRGGFIANLAPAYSAGTAGERKHLHLGIHKGNSIDYRGYVQTRSELANWLDFQSLYK